jgi:biotin transporter BioY
MGAAYFAVLTGASFADTALLAIYPFAAVEVVKAGAAVLIMSRYRR